MTAPAVLRTMARGGDPRWDAFVLAHPEGTFFHLAAWRRVIERAYPDARAHYLYVEREGAIVGVLPLFESGGWPFRRALTSVPVGVHGGVLAAEDSVAALLLGGAHAIADREGLPHVELKSERARFPSLATKGDLYVVFRQPLLGDREAQLRAIPRKARAVIREAEQAHLKAEYNRRDLEPFLDFYGQSLRNLGTPMFPRELFVALMEEYPAEAVDLLTVKECGRILGVVMNFYYKDVMLPYFVGTAPEARDVGINHYPYWFMLETGHARGFRVFDFGRSKRGTGSYDFKRFFGMTETPLEYQYDLLGGAELPNTNPTNPKYARAIEAWRRLPLGLSMRLGPLLQRRLP